MDAYRAVRQRSVVPKAALDMVKAQQRYAFLDGLPYSYAPFPPAPSK